MKKILENKVFQEKDLKNQFSLEDRENLILLSKLLV